MRIAVFAGSFDPITNGHIDIINRARKVFDKIIVLLAINPDKKGRLDFNVRLSLLKDTLSSMDNVVVDSYTGYTVDYARNHGAKYLIRGIRNSVDFAYELKMAETNRSLNKDIETVFFMASKNLENISSTDVVELYKKGTNVSSLVPNNVLAELNKII